MRFAPHVVLSYPDVRCLPGSRSDGINWVVLNSTRRHGSLFKFLQSCINSATNSILLRRVVFEGVLTGRRVALGVAQCPILVLLLWSRSSRSERVKSCMSVFSEVIALLREDTVWRTPNLITRENISLWQWNCFFVWEWAVSLIVCLSVSQLRTRGQRATSDRPKHPQLVLAAAAVLRHQRGWGHGLSHWPGVLIHSGTQTNLRAANSASIQP